MKNINFETISEFLNELNENEYILEVIITTDEYDTSTNVRLKNDTCDINLSNIIKVSTIKNICVMGG